MQNGASKRVEPVNGFGDRLHNAASMDSASVSQSDTTPQADVDEILRRKRKAREYKACYPCRQRKVKCDQAVPCKTCVAREHPELCSYHPPSEQHPPAKRLNLSSDDSPSASIHFGDGTVTMSRDEWERMCTKLNSVERVLADLKGFMRPASEPFSVSEQMRPPSPTGSIPNSLPDTIRTEKPQSLGPEGLYSRNALTGEAVHIGGSSVSALVLALARGEKNRPGVQDLLDKSILPLFGLDNEDATYPFVDLWSLPHGSVAKLTELCKALPDDAQCLEFFRHHKDIVQVVYPAITNIERLEQELQSFLLTRADIRRDPSAGSGITEQRIFGKRIGWVGLLFACLASGTRMTALPRKERDLTSQVFVCCSFECIRICNFFSSPTLETIQAMLVVSNVVSNGMNAGLSWCLIGLIIRLSQTIGLHRPDHNLPLAVQLERSKVWWAVMWQDSLLSIVYDRSTGYAHLDWPAEFPLDIASTPGNRTYTECMYRLCRMTLELVRDRVNPQKTSETLKKITEYRQEMQTIMQEAAEHLKDSRRCHTLSEHLEHWFFYLYSSYFLSELYKPAVNPSIAADDLIHSLRRECIDSLANTVEAFLGLQTITPFANRSWAAMHRSLSCAILLGIIGDPLTNERTRTLLGNFIALMSEVTATLDPEELSSPIKRSIAALRKLTQSDGSVPLRTHESTPGQLPPVGAEKTFVRAGTNDVEFGFDDSSLMGMSPFLSDPGHSPYDLLDSIMWGGATDRAPTVG